MGKIKKKLSGSQNLPNTIGSCQDKILKLSFNGVTTARGCGMLWDAVGGCQRLLIVVRYFRMLLEAVGPCTRLSHPVGCRQRLSDAVGGCGTLSKPVRDSRRLSDAVGCCWMLLEAV